MLVLYKKQLVLTMIELNNCSLSVKQQLLTHATATYSRNSYLLTQQLLTHATATYSRKYNFNRTKYSFYGRYQRGNQNLNIEEGQKDKQ